MGLLGIGLAHLFPDRSIQQTTNKKTPLAHEIIGVRRIDQQ
jgi:hypothetical protein